MNAKIFAALAAVSVLYGIGAASVHAGPSLPKPMLAQKSAKAAPAVAFSDAKGARHALKDYKGHYVLLNMWATWCGPCVMELPALTKLKQAVPGLTVLAVDLGRDKPADAAVFLKAHQAAALGTLVDTDITMMRAFGTYALPTTVLIDPSGKVIARAEGPAQWASPDSLAYFRALTKKS